MEQKLKKHRTKIDMIGESRKKANKNLEAEDQDCDHIKI